MAKDLLKRKGRKRTKMDDYADRLSLRGRHTEDRPNYSETDIEGLAIGAIEWLKAMKKERRSLGTFVIASIVGILGGIFFLSSNITGNAIADMTTKTTSFLGAGLLIVGLVAGFFWLKGRKPKHKK
jgi:hypothetical protein